MSDKSWEPGMSCKAHSFNLSFTHSRHAEQLMDSCLCSKVSVYRSKCQFFFDILLLITLSCDFRVHRAGSQLKSNKKHEVFIRAERVVLFRSGLNDSHLFRHSVGTINAFERNE